MENKRFDNMFDYPEEFPCVFISGGYRGGCLMPKSVYYQGTMKEWKRLKKDPILEEIPLINCSDGEVIQKL